MLKKINYKVSILVVNYNNAKFLSQCLDSLINQTYKNIEIIIIDDSSNDNSIDILKKYQNKTSIVRKKSKKIGVGSYDQMESYRECLKFSTGEIIVLCDSDDFFDTKKIEKVVNKFEENENYLMIYDLPILKFENKTKFIKKKSKFLKNFWSYFPPTSCISLRSKEFKDYFNLINFKDFPDIWLDFRLGILSKFIFKNLIFIEENLTYYRQTNTNISSNFKFLSKNWWRRRNQAHDYIKFFFRKNNIVYKKNLDYFITKLINKFF